MAQPEVGTPGMLRALNERRVLDLIAADGPISRAQIARDTGLSKPTVSLALSRLADHGVVTDVGRTSGGRGATALLYAVEPSAGYALAIDVGRRWVRAALLDLTGEVVARHSEHTRIRPAAALVPQLGAISRRLQADAGLAPGRVVSATLATPGVAPATGDHVSLAPSLPGLERSGALDALRAELGAELQVENDVNLAAVAELTHGVGATTDDFAYLSVGTGVGLALVLDGRLRRGATGSAGEIGYLPLGALGSGDGTATFEAAACADALTARARARGLAADGVEDVVAAARSGAADALALLDEEAEILAVGIAAVAAVADPGLVVVGGGLGAGAADLLVPRIEAALHRLSPLRPRVVATTLDNDAVLRGAMATTLTAARDIVFGAVTGPSDGAASPGPHATTAQEER